jgi:hypothetical protein
MASRIQIRRDTAQNWFDVNPELLSGEICYETDTGKLKIGTGAHWNSTDYFIYEDSKLADLFGASVNYLVTGQNHGLSEQASHGTNNLQVPFMHFDNAVEDAKSERARILVLTRVLLV